MEQAFAEAEFNVEAARQAAGSPSPSAAQRAFGEAEFGIASAAQQAAAQAVQVDPQQLEKDFRVAHGSAFDPNSSVDAAKMERLRAGRAKFPDKSPTQLALMLYRNQI